MARYQAALDRNVVSEVWAMYTPARVLVMLLLLIGACGGPSNDVDQKARYHAMIGRSGKELVQAFGPPTRRENIAGHDFLTYEESDIWPARGTGPWSPARPARQDRGTAFTCRATFVVVAGVVTTYNLSGSGC
jgi:hypothetical protein